MVRIQHMKKEDYAQLAQLWQNIPGMGLRRIDDSQEGIARFLQRNPTTCFVARQGGRIVGSILCGHDGRRGSVYHTCVDSAYQGTGVGRKLVQKALDELKKLKINKVWLVCFAKNRQGNQFWQHKGWQQREDLHYYDFTLLSDNDTWHKVKT